jgi:hypothetical protein
LKGAWYQPSGYKVKNRFQSLQLQNSSWTATPQGPETMTMLELMENFAKLNGRVLNPVFVDYRNFEMVLNVASLGNLNRQFVSLLRSEVGL